MANQELTAAIQSTFERSRGTYGAPRIHAELKSQGLECSRPRVARLMRKAGIKARRRRAYKVTTTLSKHNYPVAPNMLNRCPKGARSSGQQDLTRSGSGTLHT
jgi:putative transposase